MKLEDVTRSIDAFKKDTEEYCAEASILLKHISTPELERILGPHYGPERQNPPFFDSDPFYIMCYDVTPSIAMELKNYFAEEKGLDFAKYTYSMCSSGDGSPIDTL